MIISSLNTDAISFYDREEAWICRIMSPQVHPCHHISYNLYYLSLYKPRVVLHDGIIIIPFSWPVLKESDKAATLLSADSPENPQPPFKDFMFVPFAWVSLNFVSWSSNLSTYRHNSFLW